MTRERLVELIDAHISVAVPVGTEYANIHGIKFAADAILAEMAGEWNAAVEAAAQLAAGEPTREGRYRQWPWWGLGNRSGDSDMVKFCDALADQIRALRRPDAAPARFTAEIAAKAEIAALNDSITEREQAFAEFMTEIAGALGCQPINTKMREAIAAKDAEIYALKQAGELECLVLSEALSRIAELEAAIQAFQRDRGRHKGQHDFTRSAIPCRLCEEAYVKAESVLDAALAPAGKEVKP